MALRSHLEQETDNGDLKVSAFYVLPCISMHIKYLPVLLIAFDSTHFYWHLLSIERCIYVWRYLNDALCCIRSFHNCDCCQKLLSGKNLGKVYCHHGFKHLIQNEPKLELPLFIWPWDKQKRVSLPIAKYNFFCFVLCF